MTSPWVGPCQYPPPQPRGTGACKYLMLQKTGELRHFPESVGQILSSRSSSGAITALSQFPRSPLHHRAHCAEREGCRTSPPPSQTLRSWAWVPQGKPRVPAPSSPSTDAVVIHQGRAERLLACHSQRPHTAWLQAVFHVRWKRLHCQKRGRNVRCCPESRRGCEVGNRHSSHMGSSLPRKKTRVLEGLSMKLREQ